MIRKFWQIIHRDRQPRESTLDLMKRKAVEAGLDPAFFDEISHLPPEPGSLGPGDPGRLSGPEKGECRCSEWARETYGLEGPCPWHTKMPMLRCELADCPYSPSEHYHTTVMVR